MASKILKAGPDNSTIYMTGMGLMYKEHEILVRVNNDGSGIIGTPRSCCCLYGHAPAPALNTINTALLTPLSDVFARLV